MSNIATFLGVFLAVYLLFALAVFFGQRQLMYLPDRSTPDSSAVPLRRIEEVETVTEDGLRLRHWYVPGDGDVPLLVVFHGNGGNIEHGAFKYQSVLEAGYGLFIAEYRGYGGNPGEPSEAGLLKDGRSVLDWLDEQGVPGRKIALYGESLGSGVAVAMAAERDLGAIILESAFTSVADLAQLHYWYLPARWLVRDRFDVEALVAQVEAPMLIIQGGRDRIVPPRFGRKLHAAASEPKALKVIEQADHLDIWQRSGEAATLTFLKQHLHQENQAERSM